MPAVTDILPGESSPELLFTNFIASFETNQFLLIPSGYPVNPVTVQTEELHREEMLWKSKTLVLLVQVVSSLVTYAFSAFACRSNIQHTGFSVPLTLITPVSVAVLSSLCHFRLGDPCAYSSSFPKHLFYECPELNSANYWTSAAKDGLYGLPILFLCCFVFHLLTTAQVWEESKKKLLTITEIFGTDYYNSLLIVPSLTLNKKKAVDEDEPTSNKYKHRGRPNAGFEPGNTHLKNVKKNLITSRSYANVKVFFIKIRQILNMTGLLS